MGKKYLDTKKNSLEQSILGVWKTAVEEGSARMDGRTTQYREHRKKLESARARRASTKTQEGIEDSPNPANRQHLCAKNVVHEEWGEGQTVSTMHANPDEEGNVAWYDVIFEHGVEKGVSINELKVTKSEGHMHASYNGKKKKKVDESAVNPKDRDELDDDAKDSAKKMKRGQETAPGQMTEAQSGDKEAYKKFFDAALKKFKVKSPAEFKSDEEKKKFYDYIDKNWEGDNEKAEGAMSQVREFKIQSMKAALAQVWGMEEGKNPFAPLKKEDDESELKKKTKTETGKKAAVIDLKPKIKD